MFLELVFWDVTLGGWVSGWLGEWFAKATNPRRLALLTTTMMSSRKRNSEVADC